MKLVVVREDKYLVLCDCSREKAEDLLKKYMDMRPSKRARWLAQHGTVYRIKYDFTFDSGLVGVFTPEEFLKRYEEFVRWGVTVASQLIENHPNQARMYKFRITMLKRELEKVKEFLNSEIKKQKLERKKREKHVVKFVKISEKLHRYTHGASTKTCFGNGFELIFFDKSFWILIDNYALIVYVGSEGETLAKELAEIAKENYDTLKKVFDSLIYTNCEVPDELETTFKTVITYLALLLA